MLSSLQAQTAFITAYDTSIASYNPDGTIPGQTGTSDTYPWLAVENDSGTGLILSESLLYFDLGSYGAGSIHVDKAQLWLAYDRGATSDINLYTVNPSFSWINKPTIPTWNSTGGGLDTELNGLLFASGNLGTNWYTGDTSPSGVLTYELDPITIQQWIDIAGDNNGFALAQATGGTLPSRFSAFEHVSILKPTLLVWTSPIPEPSAATLVTIAGVFVCFRRRLPV